MADVLAMMHAAGWVLVVVVLAAMGWFLAGWFLPPEPPDSMTEWKRKAWGPEE